jgi:hypothetical protein
LFVVLLNGMTKEALMQERNPNAVLAGPTFEQWLNSTT